MIVRYDLPIFVQRGLLTTLSLDVRDDAGDALAASVGTVTVKAGSKTIVDAAAVTTGGSVTATYPLAASTTTNESLSDRWLSIWTLTIGGSVVADLQRPIYLVRRVLHAVITDTDLVDLHADLPSLRPPDLSTYQVYRDTAWTLINKSLIRAGRRPQLVIDAWALRDLHRYWTLELIFRDFASSMGEASRYRELAQEYRTLREDEWSLIEFRYDLDEDGNVDDGRQLATSPVLYLSAAPGYHR